MVEVGIIDPNNTREPARWQKTTRQSRQNVWKWEKVTEKNLTFRNRTPPHDWTLRASYLKKKKNRVNNSRLQRGFLRDKSNNLCKAQSQVCELPPKSKFLFIPYTNPFASDLTILKMIHLNVIKNKWLVRWIDSFSDAVNSIS